MVSYGRAEYPRVFDRGGQVEIAKFDKEARQDYNLILPKWEYNNYANQGKTISKLSQEQGKFLRSSLTPAEQRIVQDPTYQRAVDNLMKAPPTAFDAERAAILNEANSSQLEPYDYNLSLRHQAFNAALHQRPDVNHSIKEIDWIKDVSQAQYRSQIGRDPFFNPETRLSPTPAWVKHQVRYRETIICSARKRNRRICRSWRFHKDLGRPDRERCLQGTNRCRNAGFAIAANVSRICGGPSQRFVRARSITTARS